MGIQDDFDKADQIAHMAQTLSFYSDMLILSVTGKSVGTRAMATEAANAAGAHLWDDILFLVNVDKADTSVELDEDFKMWAKEL